MDEKLSKDDVIKLIRLYRSHANLWDKNVDTFRCKTMREKSYKEIGSEMGLSTEIVRKKLLTLRSAYNRQKKRFSQRKSEKYIPELLWFSEMCFLDNFIGKNATLKNSNPVSGGDNEDTSKEMKFSLEIEKERVNLFKSTCEGEIKNVQEKEIIPGINKSCIEVSGEQSSVRNPIVVENEAEMIDQSYENKCHICMNENVELDWNEILYDCSRLTYKDCFYKYTQLEFSDEDNFSTMLCRNCSNDLKYIDAFISKAIEAHVKLKEKLRVNRIIGTDDDNIVVEAPKFETVLVEELEIKAEIEEGPVEDFTIIPPVDKNFSLSETCSKPLSEIMEEPKYKKIKTGNEYIVNGKKKWRRVHQPVCCSICPKVLSSKYKAIAHERTHFNKNNRERKETCVHCGLKLLSKEILKSHLLTHAENRPKPHKCEYCDKTFYHKSGLKLHLRKHLGQMFPCLVCTKQFYRQNDLDKHMVSHSSSRIDSDIQFWKKSFVRCKECGKNIRSPSFKAHTARHMNQPLFKCSICDKEFFLRKSCRRHLKNNHKKANEEIRKFIIAYPVTNAAVC